jgi:hypothetical protein
LGSQSSPYRFIEGLLEGKATLSHGVFDESFDVRIEGNSGPHDAIIASID